MEIRYDFHENESFFIQVKFFQELPDGRGFYGRVRGFYGRVRGFYGRTCGFDTIYNLIDRQVSAHNFIKLFFTHIQQCMSQNKNKF